MELRTRAQWGSPLHSDDSFWVRGAEPRGHHALPFAVPQAQPCLGDAAHPPHALSTRRLAGT